MVDETTGGSDEMEMAGIAAQEDRNEAAARESARGGQPLTEQEVRETMMRQGGIESARDMVADLQRGDIKTALKRINPSIKDEILNQEVEVFNSIKESETLEDPIKDAMIGRWKRLGTPQEAAEMLIEASKLDPAEKAAMKARIKEELEPMNDEGEDVPHDEAVRNEAQVQELQRQIDDEIEQLPEDQRQTFRDRRDAILGKLRGKTAKRWMKWGGRTLLWGAIIALVLLLAEAKLFSSVAGGRGGGR